LAAFVEFVAPASWRAIDFISDLHLSELTPRSLAAFEQHLLNTEADAVFLLGDVFEVWPGDDARHGGFEQQGAALLREAASRRTLAFMAGNRDFMIGSDLLDECGITLLVDPTVLVAFGRRVLLSHGDELCLADVEYQRFRAQVRDPAWRAAVLGKPLSERRALARAMRDASERRKREHGDAPWADVDVPTTIEWMKAAITPDLVHGHTHRPDDQVLAPGLTRHVLSDWDLEDAAHPPRAEVLTLSAQGLRRRPPA